MVIIHTIEVLLAVCPIPFLVKGNEVVKGEAIV